MAANIECVHELFFHPWLFLKENGDKSTFYFAFCYSCHKTHTESPKSAFYRENYSILVMVACTVSILSNITGYM